MDPLDPTTGDRLGPYVLGDVVARGGMATVYEAVDTRDGARRAVKLIHPIRGHEEAKTRFLTEFRTLSRLDHPNVLRVYESGMAGDRPWFGMELISGQVLRDEVEGWSSLQATARFRRAEALLRQIASALSYIHDRGLIHRDLTPLNVMVGPEGHATLMDFGVVKEMGGAELTQLGEVIGTVAFMAPEQVEGHAIDARADLYSLGAVLYLMLTGQRPFQARSLKGYLQKHLTETPRPPRELQPLVPHTLDAVCVRLLEKKPTDRYASANHVLHALGAGALRANARQWPPRTLVGRPLLRARVADVVDTAVAGRAGRTLLLRSEPGQGKSFLMDAAEAIARDRGLRTARATCRPQDRPFGPFVSLYQQLRDDVESPVLHQALLGEDDNPGERYPVLAAFRELLVARAPCVVLIDDLHEAEAATIEMIEYVVHNTQDLGAVPVSFVLAEDGTRASRLTRRLPVERHHLQALSSLEVEELVLSALPDEPATQALARRLHAESGGSPALVIDMLRGLRDTGLVAQVDGVWRLTIEKAALDIASLPLPASLRQVLQERLRPLGPAALEVARTLAAARRNLELDTLVEASEMDEDVVMDALDELVDAAIVVERLEDDHNETGLSHSRFRDVLLDGESAAALEARHRRIGEVVERRWRNRVAFVVEELAYHFERGGVPPKAYVYLLKTAARHQRRSLFDESLDFLDRALAMEASARPFLPIGAADRHLAELHLSRATALHQLGRWDAALTAAREAESAATRLGDARTRSRVAAVLGDQLRQVGDLDEAARQLQTALDLSTELQDDTLRAMPLYWLGAVRWLQGSLTEPERLWTEALACAQRAADERAAGWGYNGLGIMAICHGRPLDARRYLEQSAALFERLGNLTQLAIVRVNLVELYLSLGLLRKALELAERVIGTARETQHTHGVALGLVYLSQVLLALAREDDALQNATEALRLLRQLGTREDEVLALVTLARIALQCDQPELALQHLEDLDPLLAEFDGEGITVRARARHAEALAVLGRRAEARAILDATELDAPAWQHVQVRNELAVGRTLQALDDPEPAIHHLGQALTLAEKNHYRYYQLVAHHLLARLTASTEVGRHRRTATSLARSLAAGLPRDAADRFLDKWLG
jgi:tetratricopeptide (TPR) repeat protein